MTVVYSPLREGRPFPSPFPILTHRLEAKLHHTVDQPFVTRSLDFPFSARFHRDDTDIPALPFLSPSSSSRPRPLFMRRGFPGRIIRPGPPKEREREIDRVRRDFRREESFDTDTALAQALFIRGEGSFSRYASAILGQGGRRREAVCRSFVFHASAIVIVTL